jgi:hypothetical protein
VLSSMSEDNLDVARLVNGQREVDIAYAHMEDYKAHAIVEMMNSTTRSTNPISVENDEPKYTYGSISSPWKNWFVVSCLEEIGDGGTVDVVCSHPHTLTIPNAGQDGGGTTAPTIETEFANRAIANVLLDTKTTVGGSSEFLDALRNFMTTSNGRVVDYVWVHSNDTNTSTMTASGLSFELQKMSNISHVSDHRFEQYVICRNITRGFQLQAMTLTISLCNANDQQSHLPRCTTTLHAAIYPRHDGKDTAGMLVGVIHCNDMSPGQQPQYSVIDTNNLALTCSGPNGINEEDAAFLLVTHTREYLNKLVDVFVASHVMRVVHGNHTGLDYDIPHLRDMTEATILSTHQKLQVLCNDTLEEAQNIFLSMRSVDAPGHYSIECTDGTIDCFDKGKQHTDMALHTANIVDIEFIYNGCKISIHENISASMYATYYTGGVREAEHQTT